MEKFPITKAGGVALIAGSIMLMAGMLIRPSGPIVASVADPLSVSELAVVIQNNTALASGSTVVLIISMGLLTFGMIVLKEEYGAEGLGNGFLRLGLAITVLALISYLLQISWDQVFVYSLHEREPTLAPPEHVAATIQATKVGVGITTAYLYALGVTFHAFGMVLRLQHGIHRNIAFVISALGLTAFVFIVVAQISLGVSWISYVANTIILPTSVWYLIIGDTLFNSPETLTWKDGVTPSADPSPAEA